MVILEDTRQQRPKYRSSEGVGKNVGGGLKSTRSNDGFGGGDGYRSNNQANFADGGYRPYGGGYQMNGGGYAMNGGGAPGGFRSNGVGGNFRPPYYQERNFYFNYGRSNNGNAEEGGYARRSRSKGNSRPRSSRRQRKFDASATNDDESKEQKKDVAARSKSMSFGRLPNEVLRKIFSYLDFWSRIHAESVCKRWRSTMLKNVNKLPPAEGKPKNVSFVISMENNPTELKGTVVKFDKAENRMTITFVEKDRRFTSDKLHSFLSKMLPKFSGHVISVSMAGYIKVNKSIFEMLIKFCAENCDFSFDGVILINVPFAFVQSFVHHLDTKLKVIPEFPLTRC